MRLLQGKWKFSWIKCSITKFFSTPIVYLPQLHFGYQNMQRGITVVTINFVAKRYTRLLATNLIICELGKLNCLLDGSAQKVCAFALRDGVKITWNLGSNKLINSWSDESHGN